MHFVYILQSLSHPDRFYTGLCKDVDARLAAHNGSIAPQLQIQAVETDSCHWFERVETASAFERYLKSGSGRAFAVKRLR